MKRGRLAALMVLALSPLAACAPLAPPSPPSLNLMQAPMDAAGLVGSTPQVLNAEFGKPALLRMDGTAQVWLYHAPDCGLNLILYPDASGTPRVALVTPTADSAVPAACTASLQRAHVDAALEHSSPS